MALRQDRIIPEEAAPLPDLWLPLNDRLTLFTGEGSYETLAGDITKTLPSKKVSLSRDSAATYIGKNGILMTVQSNEPRFEKDGLLMEGASTNQVLNSTDPSKWGSSASITKTTLANDGYSQSPTCKAVINTEVTLATVVKSVALTMAVGDPLSASCRAKGNYGVIRISFDGPSTTLVAYVDAQTGVIVSLSTGVTCTATLLGDGYISISANFAAVAAGSHTCSITVSKSGSDPVVPVNSEYYVQMPQVELNTVSTSYIPTGAATTTRAAETLVMLAAGNVGYNKLSDPLNRTVAVEVTVDRMGRWSGAYFDMLEANGANYDKIIRAHVNQFESFRSSGSLKLPVSYPIPRSMFVQSIDQNNNLALYLGNGSVSLLAAPYQPNTGASLLQFKSNSNCVYHIRNFRIWQQLLTPGQIKGLR